MNIHPSAKIHPSVIIDCNEITIGAGAKIGKNCQILGNDVSIGRDFWMDEGAIIGGGSCFDKQAFLVAGDFLHMGKDSLINIARGVTIGEEVGIGVRTQLNTHGAYLNELQGFPVQFEGITIGSNVWLPNAWVNPGVVIGDNVVVAAGSLINRNIPAGSLAAGSPAKVIKENYYPKQLSTTEMYKIVENILDECRDNMTNLSARVESREQIHFSDLLIINNDTEFHLLDKKIHGPVTEESEMIRNQLRRHGIRFRYSVSGNIYVYWGTK